MVTATHDTLLLEAPSIRDEAYRTASADRTRALARLVRHALRAPAAAAPLDVALRSAVRRAVPATAGRPSEDEEFRVRQVARQMSALLAQRRAPLACPHRETVRT